MPPYPNAQRWPVAIAGTFLQIGLGTVYAWSFFQKPITVTYGWSNESVTWVFSLAICFLGLSAAWGGFQLKSARLSPRSLALAGGILFSLGHFMAAAALSKGLLWLLLLGYGVVGGTGLGLAYVVPVATAAKWFPDKKGLITGMVVMGFGLGALLMSKVLAPLALRVFNQNLALSFAAMGAVFSVLIPAAAWFMKNPPSAGSLSGKPDSAGEIPVSETDRAPAGARFMALWLLFFCNIFVGISIISFQSPLLQNLLLREHPGMDASSLAGAGATLIACGAIFNGLGRFLWGAVSDRMGQSRAFSAMMGTQVLVFLFLPKASNPWLFGTLVCYILLCYGGGFGTIPAYVQALFGPTRMAMLYGVILTAWSAAGIAGPKFMAWLLDNHPDSAARTAFLCSSALVAFGFVLTFVPSLRTPRDE
ncbi:MAG: MFS transporter [Luteolibacter sp.]